MPDLVIMILHAHEGQVMCNLHLESHGEERPIKEGWLHDQHCMTMAGCMTSGIS